MYTCAYFFFPYNHARCFFFPLFLFVVLIVQSIIKFLRLNKDFTHRLRKFKRSSNNTGNLLFIVISDRWKHQILYSVLIVNITMRRNDVTIFIARSTVSRRTFKNSKEECKDSSAGLYSLLCFSSLYSGERYLWGCTMNEVMLKLESV